MCTAFHFICSRCRLSLDLGVASCRSASPTCLPFVRFYGRRRCLGRRSGSSATSGAMTGAKRDSFTSSVARTCALFRVGFFLLPESLFFCSCVSAIIHRRACSLTHPPTPHPLWKHHQTTPRIQCQCEVGTPPFHALPGHRSRPRPNTAIESDVDHRKKKKKIKPHTTTTKI